MIDTERKPRKPQVTPEQQDRLRYEIEQAILTGASQWQTSKRIRATQEFKDLSRETIRNTFQRVRIRLGEIHSRSMSAERKAELIGMAIGRYQHIFNLALEAKKLDAATKANTCMAELQGLTQPHRGASFGAGLQRAVISNQQHHVASVIKNLEDHATPHAVALLDG